MRNVFLLFQDSVNDCSYFHFKKRDKLEKANLLIVIIFFFLFKINYSL